MTDYCNEFNTFALSNKCYPLNSPDKTVMKSWLKGKNVYVGETPLGNRLFTPFVFTTGFRFMDVITGSMYLPNGQCLSSSYLRVKSFIKLKEDIPELIKILLKSKKN